MNNYYLIQKADEQPWIQKIGEQTKAKQMIESFAQNEPGVIFKVLQVTEIYHAMGLITVKAVEL